jgi:K+ transporter
VISAVEGLSVASKAADAYVVPLSLAIVVALFALSAAARNA